MANRQPQGTPSKKDDNKQQAREASREKSEKLIDETVWESFPASDPSGSWAGRDIPPQEREASERKKDN